MASIRFPSLIVTFSSLWLLFATCVSAFVEIPFTKRTDSNHAAPERRRQVQTDTRIQLDHSSFSFASEFLANFSVGTPPQEVSLVISLSTSDTWVMDITTCANGPYSSALDCYLGFFDPNESDSFERISRDSFYVTLPGGSWVEGDLISETFHVGSAKLEDTTLGLGFDSDTMSPVGVLGLGYDTAGLAFLNRLQAEGHINSTAFSVWPTSANASEGSLLLGAVDTNKFSGDLQRFQAYKYSMQYTGFYAKIGSVNASSADDGDLEPIIDESLHADLPFTGIDPTAPYANLPRFIAEPIWDLAGAIPDLTFGQLPSIPCARAPSLTGRVSLELGGRGGYILTANLRDLVIPEDVYSYEYYAYDDDESFALEGEEMCVLAVQSIEEDYYDSDAGHWFIGGPFLRDTYLAFDLANEEVGMAPVVRSSDATRANIVPFASSSATIPQSTKVGQSWCWAYQDCQDDDVGGDRAGDDSGWTGSGNNDGYNGDRRDRRPDSISVSIAAGIGAGVGSVLLFGSIFGIWAFRRYRRIRKEESETGVIKHPPGIILVGKDGEPLTVKEAKDPDEPESPPLPPRPAVTRSTTRMSRNDVRRSTTVLPPISEDPTGLALPTAQAGQTEQTQMAGALDSTNDPSQPPRPVSPLSTEQPVGDVPPHAASDSPVDTGSSAQAASSAAEAQPLADPQSSTTQQKETETLGDETGAPRLPKPPTQE